MLTLTAVNLILRKCGGPPVPVLDTDGPSRAGEAQRCLDEEELRIQSVGWTYNTRRDVELTPDTVTRKITIPVGVITIDSDGQDYWRHVTQLGETLYDIDNNVDTFTGSLRVRYTLRYEFECIPEPIAAYIACQAATTMYENMPAGRDMARMVSLRADRDRAQASAKRFNAVTIDANILTTPDALRVKGDRFVSSRVFGTNGRLVV